MKSTVYTIVLLIILSACGAPAGDSKAELEKLRAERSELDAKIAELEKNSAASDTSGNTKAIEVVASNFTPEIFKTYIEIQGKIDADEHVNLSSEIPGTVTKINVKVGDKVSKGQVLAETDARAIQQQMADLQSSLDLARLSFSKQKSLWDQKIGTEMQFLQSKNMVESLELKMGTMQEQLRMTRVITPINGTVDQVAIKIGQAISPGMPAISVINFTNLKVKADVAESYSARIKTGNEVLIVFPDMNDSIRSKVNYASRAIDPLSRTFNVEVNLDGKKEYHPNMVTKMKINDYISPSPKIVVPVKYIQKNSGESYVLVAENNKVVKKPVKLGHEYRGIAEIESGLTAADLVITEGYDLVDAGDKVIVRSAETNSNTSK